MKPSPEKILQAVTQRFVDETGYMPVVACEIEFYLTDVITDAFKDACYLQFGASGILTFEFAEEKAQNHYEISLVHQPDPLLMAQSTIKVKRIIEETSRKYGLDATFAAKPFAHKPGSGLHIHVSMRNKEGINPFTKKGSDDETASLKAAIGGLCAMMPESMVFFAPTKASYARFTAETNEGEKEAARYNNAPVNISWGGNNRTTAIRIPASTLIPENRHIEHRVAGSDADPVMVIAVILAGMQFGLMRNIDAGPKIWGNAFELQYNLPALPLSLDEAEKNFKEGKLLKKYIPELF
jgi:glutamine synthetase